MVILHTNHGDITLELDAENAPATVANFLQYVRDGHYDNTIFHRVIDGFMIQGGGMEPGMKQKPVRAPDRQRSGQRTQEQALHGRDGAHVRPALGDRAVLHQRRRQRLPRPQGAEPARLGLLRVRAGERRAGRRRQDQGRRDGEQRLPPERADGKDVVDRARRGSPHKADAVPLRPAPVAGAAGAGRGVRCVLRGPGARCGRRLLPGRSVRRWIGDDQLREPLADARRAALRSVAERRRAGRRIDGNRDFLLGERFAEAAGATLLPEQIVIDLAGTPTLLLHGDELCTDDVGYQRFRARRAQSAVAAALSRAALCAAPQASRQLLRRQEPRRAQPPSRNRSWTSSQRAVEAAFRAAKRHADDPRPHASPGAASPGRRRARLRALGARRLVRPRQLPRSSTPAAAWRTRIG